ncbi:Poly A polymerase, head domain, partial [Dillenia turbinata]
LSKMAIAGIGGACRIQLGLRRPLLYCLHKVRYSASVVNAESIAEPTDVVHRRVHGNGNNNVLPSEWKMLNSKDLGISSSEIAKPTRLVLKELKKKGIPCSYFTTFSGPHLLFVLFHVPPYPFLCRKFLGYEVFLVGGCVRDLILNRTPKDFDIITSAELKEILRTFPRCEVVGKRFPICHVHVGDTIVEVSSFSTSARKLGGRATIPFRKPQGCDEGDYARWRNCLQRDFTINGLMFDPFAKVVYDYLGGIEDIEKAKVRTVIPANVSFVDDCARILRAVRIAARLGFRFTRETAHFVKEFSGSVLRLDRVWKMMDLFLVFLSHSL